MFRPSLLPLIAAISFLVAPPASATDQVITEAFGRAVQPCWRPPLDPESTAVVRLRIAPDGALSGEAMLDKGGQDAGIFAESALRAVRDCAPYPTIGKLIDDDTVEIRATFSLGGFSAVTEEGGAPKTVEGVTIRASEDILLRVPESKGLCYVDPAGGGLQLQYFKRMSSLLDGNHVHGFFLDCGTVRQLEAGEADFTLPKHTMTLFSPLERSGKLQRLPQRSQAQAVAYYEALFEREGALESQSRAMEERLHEAWDVAVKSGHQVVAAVDERAVYTAMVSTAETETETLRQMSIGSYGQVFDLPITLSLYAPYEEGGTDELLAKAQKVMAAMYSNSVRVD